MPNTRNRLVPVKTVTQVSFFSSLCQIRTDYLCHIGSRLYTNCDDHFGVPEVNKGFRAGLWPETRASKENVFQTKDDRDDIGGSRTIARSSADDLDENVADEAQADAFGN